MKLHRFPKDMVKPKWWQKLVSKGGEKIVASDKSKISSNHFVDGKPTKKHQNSTLLLTFQGNKH